MRCRHPRSQRQTINHADWDLLYDCNICRACGSWLPLGPANDKPEAVKVEIRAAEIAMRPLDKFTSGDDLHSFADGSEIAGWIEHAFDSQKVPEQFGEQAGWLARAIATHEEG